MCSVRLAAHFNIGLVCTLVYISAIRSTVLRPLGVPGYLFIDHRKRSSVESHVRSKFVDRHDPWSAPAIRDVPVRREGHSMVRFPDWFPSYRYERLFTGKDIIFYITSYSYGQKHL